MTFSIDRGPESAPVLNQLILGVSSRRLTLAVALGLAFEEGLSARSAAEPYLEAKAEAGEIDFAATLLVTFAEGNHPSFACRNYRYAYNADEPCWLGSAGVDVCDIEDWEAAVMAGTKPDERCWKNVTDLDVLSALARMKNEGPIKGLNESYRSKWIGAFISGDAGHFDAYEADLFIQYMVFGEVLYG